MKISTDTAIGQFNNSLISYGMEAGKINREVSPEVFEETAHELMQHILLDRNLVGSERRIKGELIRGSVESIRQHIKDRDANFSLGQFSAYQEQTKPKKMSLKRRAFCCFKP